MDFYAGICEHKMIFNGKLPLPSSILLIEVRNDQIVLQFFFVQSHQTFMLFHFSYIIITHVTAKIFN